MPSMRDRVSDWLLGNEKQALREAAGLLTEAYQVGPRVIPPEILLQKLTEYDSRLVDLLARQIMNGATGLVYEDTEQERIRMVDVSRRMWSNDPITSNIVSTWTDFGFGLNVDVTPRDENGSEVWKEFWEAPRNNYILGARQIADLSSSLLVDGDFLFVFFISTITGKVTLRTISTDKIKGGDSKAGILTHPDDANVSLWYRVENDTTQPVTYYPDWRVTEEELSIVKFDDGIDARSINESTQVVAMLVKYNARKQRGWPLLTTGFEWSKAYKTFLEDRAAVARAVAMYIDKVKVSGGQRAIDSIATRLQSSLATGGYSETNPRPTAGATWLENDAANRERFNLGTGASDAEKDGSALIAMAGISARIYAHWLGRGEAFRLATASAMEMPTLRAFNRYQLFWASVWKDITGIVLRAAVDYGGVKIVEFNADVSQDALITSRVEDLEKVANIVMQGYDRQAIDTPKTVVALDQIMRQGLQSVGVKDIDDLIGAPITVDDVEEPERPAPAPAPAPVPPEATDSDTEQPPPEEEQEETLIPGLEQAVSSWQKTLYRVIAKGR